VMVMIRMVDLIVVRRGLPPKSLENFAR